MAEVIVKRFGERRARLGSMAETEMNEGKSDVVTGACARTNGRPANNNASDIVAQPRQHENGWA